jgi:tripartite-type tricarboxylate transporter receptor subunit TctC
MFSILFAGCSTKTQSTQSKPGSGNGSAAEKTETQKEQKNTQSDFPNKPIKLIVPFNAGGATDTYGRILANAVSKYLPKNQPVVVVNKPGAGGITGSIDVYKADPDGYTIGLLVNGVVSIQPLYGKTVYNYDDFKPIARVVSSPLVLIVRKDAPWQTYEEWLEYVKQNPGKFKYAHGGVGSTLHLAMEAVTNELGIDIKPVPFDGGAQVTNAIMGGHVQGAILGASDAISQLESGDLRVLFNVSSHKNAAYLDKAPLLMEKGLDINFDGSYSLFAPKGIPDDVFAILHNAFKKAMEEPEVIEQFKKVGLPPSYDTPENVTNELAKTNSKIKPILIKLGLIK